MADKVAVYPPFFFGIGMNYEDYKDVEIAEWLAVVAIFYVAIAYINGYYKSQFYNGQIIRYGSYRRWLTRHFISLTITCILIAACDYAVFASGNELRLCFVMVLSMALNFIFKAVFVFLISNQKNYNLWTCTFIIFEVYSIHKPQWTKFNPFVWSMAVRGNMLEPEGYNVYLAIAIEIIAICILYVLEKRKKYL